MRRIYTLLLILSVLQFVLAFICGPYSCEWGNNVYFCAGIVCLLAAAALPLFEKNLRTSKRLFLSFLFLLASLLVWAAGFMAADFRIICKLF